MKTQINHVVTVHSQLQDIGEDDHHNRGVSFLIVINSQSLSPGNTEIRASLGKTGFKTASCFARGLTPLPLTGGHDGQYFYGTDTALESQAKAIKSSGSFYMYVGAFSRLHGDSYLGDKSIFGSNLRVLDFYLDGTDIVFLINNSFGSSQNLRMYATGLAK